MRFLRIHPVQSVVTNITQLSDILIFPTFDLIFFENFGPEMGSRRAGRGLKRFLEAVGFILAKFEPKRSHGDPIRDQNYGFGTYDMCWNVGISKTYPR